MFGMSVLLLGYALPALYQTRRKGHDASFGGQASSCFWDDRATRLLRPSQV